MFWELLTEEQKKVLKETSCYKALLGGTCTTFRANRNYMPTSRFLGLASALREHFGGKHGPYTLGTH